MMIFLNQSWDVILKEPFIILGEKICPGKLTLDQFKMQLLSFKLQVYLLYAG